LRLPASNSVNSSDGPIDQNAFGAVIQLPAAVD